MRASVLTTWAVMAVALMIDGTDTGKAWGEMPPLPGRPTGVAAPPRQAVSTPAISQEGLAPLTPYAQAPRVRQTPTLGARVAPPRPGTGCVYSLQSPGSVKQGHTLFARVSREGNCPDGLPDLTLALSNHSLRAPLYWDREEQVWTAWFPVRVDAPVGANVLTLFSPSVDKPLASLSLDVTSGNYTRQNIALSSGMSGLKLSDQEVGLIQTRRNASSGTRYFTDTPSQTPWLAPVTHCISGPFGDLRYHNGKFTGNFHRGMDHASPTGAPIVAPAGGVVKLARMLSYHGGTTLIDHGQGITTIYIHQSKLLVSEGERVAAGQKIGQVGATGFATGPHLHWGVFVHGQPVNPRQWIPARSRCK